MRRTDVVAKSSAVNSSSAENRDGWDFGSVLLLSERLLSIPVPATEHATLAARAGGVVVVRARAVLVVAPVLGPHGELPEEGDCHKTGTGDRGSKGSGVETGSEAKVDTVRASSGGLTVSERSVDETSAAIAARAIEDGDSNECTADQGVSDETEDERTDLTTEAADHERRKGAVDDSNTRQTFNSLPVLGDTLGIVSHGWMVRRNGMRRTESC